jgi:hypothetical protein
MMDVRSYEKVKNLKKIHQQYGAPAAADGAMPAL